MVHAVRFCGPVSYVVSLVLGVWENRIFPVCGARTDKRTRSSILSSANVHCWNSMATRERGSPSWLKKLETRLCEFHPCATEGCIPLGQKRAAVSLGISSKKTCELEGSSNFPRKCQGMEVCQEGIARWDWQSLRVPNIHLTGYRPVVSVLSHG